MKRDESSVSKPDGIPGGNMDVEEWLIKQEVQSSAKGQKQTCESCFNTLLISGADEGKTPLPGSHSNRIDLELKTSKAQPSPLRGEQSFTSCSIRNQFISHPVALPNNDFCEYTSATVTSTVTTTIIHQTQEDIQLHSIMIQEMSVMRTDADVIDADVERAISSILCQHQQYAGPDILDLSTITVQPILVEAKWMPDLNNQRLLPLICLVLAAIIGGVVFAVVLMMFNYNSLDSIGSASQIQYPMNETKSNHNLSALPFLSYAPSNSTIGDHFADLGGRSVFSVGYLYECTQIYLKTLDRLDTKFTVISFRIDLLTGVLDETALERFLNPSWTGHVVDILLNRIIEGQVLAYPDITDGLVVNTMAGYPMQFFKYPNFTINGDVVEFGNTYYTNGVVHNLAQVPDPLVPWLYKTNYEILLEVNNQRNGDLSEFIALVNASQLKDRLMMDDYSKPITLFVPTNDAMSTIMIEEDHMITNVSSLSYTQLLNHVVEGNFVIRDWLRVPTGTMVSDTELHLKSEAGNVLQVEMIRDERVKINGIVNVIKKDVFSYFGVLQIIDLPLFTS